MTLMSVSAAAYSISEVHLKQTERKEKKLNFSQSVIVINKSDRIIFYTCQASVKTSWQGRIANTCILIEKILLGMHSRSILSASGSQTILFSSGQLRMISERAFTGCCFRDNNYRTHF
jgi:hypothetical protein